MRMPVGYLVAPIIALAIVSWFSESLGLGLPHISAPHIEVPHIQPPKIQVPHIPVPAITIPGTNVAITPVGPLPSQVIPPAQNLQNKATDALSTTANAAANVASKGAEAAVAPQVSLVNVIAGQENLSDAGKRLIQSQGDQIVAVGEAVSDTNAAANGVTVVAAQTIAGNVGKTTAEIVVGPTRLEVEFAATAAIEAGEIAKGQISPDRLIAEPLAAAIRAAEKQFQDQAKPLPDAVKVILKGAYPSEVLENARWAVGSFSISVPDITNTWRKAFEGVDNAVTVGHVTVFRRDPGDDYHWWAHEMQHQVQYRRWGIDEFAYQYVTDCHNVESEAENKAQEVVPTGTVALSC